MKTITAYRCEYCGKVYISKQYAKKHEGICFYNPERKACATCAFPYYMLADQTNPYSEEHERLCKKRNNIRHKLKHDCPNYKNASKAGVSGWHTVCHPNVIERQKNCKHENQEYENGSPDAKSICLDCMKILEEKT
jgi:hypothetical protein